MDGKIDMCKAINDMVNEGIELGLKKGREEASEGHLRH